MNDDEIINLFLKRDENGIIELSTKYHPYCYKIAWNLLANREDAEECLNDTWFSVWSQIPPTHPPVLAHFCGRITRNLSIDRLRKKFAGKRPDVHMADVMEEMEQLNVTKTSGPDRDHCDPASDFNLRIPGKCNHSLVWRIPEKKCIPDTKRNELFGKCDS